MAMEGENAQRQQSQEQTFVQVFMAKGDGEESYAKNSGLQAAMNKMWLSALNDALGKMTLPAEEGSSVAVVDLGSSSGPNTINNLTLIIDKLRLRLPKQNPQFTAYFNDLPSNDFNNLFHLLSNDSRAKNFYPAGVPGSFFERLFPQSSVHVFFSSLCLHWLSEMPHEILDKDSSAYNGGSSWIAHSRSAAAASYQRRSSLDLVNFLQARAAELVPGGLLFFTCLGRLTSNPSEPTNCSFNECQVDTDRIWSDLVGEGLVTEHQRDTFNIPCYCRSIGELTEAIASCGSLFNVLTAKLEPIDLSFTKLFATSEPAALSRKMTATYKAGMNSLFEGKEASMVFWQRYEKLVEERIRMNPTQDPTYKGQLCIVALIRN